MEDDLPAGDEIHLWLAYYDEITDERLHGAYRSLLSQAEREQQLRFYFERDRLRYLVTRALVRSVLGRYLTIDPRDLTFGTNEFGRPHVANVLRNSARIAFNISHTHSLIALGVTRDRELGVDVERIAPRRASIEMADRFFSPAEAVALRNTSHERQIDRFFEYWTFKESYIKARGMGLSLPLEKFSFDVAREGAVSFQADADLDVDPRRWQFWQLRPRSEYLLAVCAERTMAARFVVRKIVPQVSEELIAHTFSRRSGQPECA